MVRDLGEMRGRVMVRPWRVAVLADTTSAESVREAIAALSGVWGGKYMPILDVGTPPSELEQLGSQYDVDSLYAEEADGTLGDLLRAPGWAWGFRGPWGPFREEHGLRKGLLPTRSFLGISTNFVQPTWPRDDPADLLLAATWGVPDELGLSLSPSVSDRGPRTASYTDMRTNPASGEAVIGALAASSLHVRPSPRDYLNQQSGLYVIRQDHPADVVHFWNMRTYGVDVVGVPAEASEELLTLLLPAALSGIQARTFEDTEPSDLVLPVWGLQNASQGAAREIRAAVGRHGLQSRAVPPASFPPYLFQGLETSFRRSIRTDFRPGAHWVDTPLPPLSLEEEPRAFTRGVVAAEIQLHDVVGQDPRLTASIPPYRRHTSIIPYDHGGDPVDHVRSTGSGVVLGVDATRDQVRVPFVYNQDVFRLLFDDESVRTSQSDIGRFQSRAAEKFGGVFSGALNQPGTRAVLTLAAGRNTGVPMQHLRRRAEETAGRWPDPVYGPRLGPKDYAHRQVNQMLHSGVFVPTLRVHCSHCRVESWAAADELAATMRCEFCGETFHLALSHSLAYPEWRYRLAAHLRADQVQALLPALAAMSLLGQLRHVEEPPLPHVLGLEVSLDGNRTIEVDVAAYLPDPEWTVVLGEVKASNRIDDKDVSNLEFLRNELSQKGVRCVLLFATLKEKLAPEEVNSLRGLVERAHPVQSLYGDALLPNAPLVLTQPDLSQPPRSTDHPWRWRHDAGSGTFGTALASCERNLGLRNYRVRDQDDEPGLECDWDS